MPDTRNVLEEQIRKGGSRLPAGLPWQLLIFSFVILAITVASYLGMIFGYIPYLNSQINGIDARIVESEKAVNKQQRDNLTNLYSQLINVQSLLGSHVAASSLFDSLEKDTNPQVYYTSLSLSLIENKLGLSGIAPNYTVLTQQLNLLKNDSLFSDILLRSAKSVSDGVNFEIEIFWVQNGLNQS